MEELRKALAEKRHFDDFIEMHRQFTWNRGLLPFSSYVLYLFVRTYKPKTIVEMSPNYGWSTFIMLTAAKDEKYEIESFKSFDLFDSQDSIVMPLRKELGSRFEFYLGDAKESLKPEHMENLDFFFIDSDHSFSFAKWYEQFLDKPRFFFVDDIDPSEEYQRRFRPELENVHCGGEPLVVYDWLRRKGFVETEERVNYLEEGLTASPNESGDFRCFWKHQNSDVQSRLFWVQTEQMKLSSFKMNNCRNVYFQNSVTGK